MLDRIVCKFGGSSIAAGVKRLGEIVEDDPRRKIIVVSAPGRTNLNHIKVTDRLIGIIERTDRSEKYLELETTALYHHYMEAFSQVAVDNEKEFKDDLVSRIENLDGSLKHQDALKAFGEEWSARLFAQYIGAEFVDAGELLRISETGELLEESTSLIQERLAEDKVYVIPGFYGKTNSGRIVTFKRGGSDLSATQIAGAINAKECEIFSDEDGIRAADPKRNDGKEGIKGMVRDPEIIKVMTYDEMRELPFDILHEEAILPVRWEGIPIHVRNTFNYPLEGTHIVKERGSDEKRPIIGVGYRKGLYSFNMKAAGMNQQVDLKSRIFAVFEERGIPQEMVITSRDGMAILFGENYLTDFNILNKIIKELEEIIDTKGSYVKFKEHLASVIVAGKGLEGNKGIAAEIQDVLKDKRINLYRILQADEGSITYIIESVDCELAVNALYDHFIRYSHRRK